MSDESVEYRIIETLLKRGFTAREAKALGHEIARNLKAYAMAQERMRERSVAMRKHQWQNPQK